MQKISKKAYEAELARLHVGLVKVQEWVCASGHRVAIVFEGRNAAGKGSTIKRIPYEDVVKLASRPPQNDHGRAPIDDQYFVPDVHRRLL